MSTNENDKSNAEAAINFEELDTEETWRVLFGKPLNTKKNILEYINMTKVLRQNNVSNEKIQDTYTFIYNSIDKLDSTVKVNTKVHLKNQLKAELGKYVKDKDPKPINHFIEFFKEAYPENNRRKDFTWVLTDINKITDEQIWTTLAYIHGWLLKEGSKLDANQKKDIIKMVELLVSRSNIKYINDLRSLENLLSILNIKIISAGKGFKVKKI